MSEIHNIQKATIKDGGPAFPYSQRRQMVGTIYADNVGMSLRDYFAAQALKGMLSQPADQQNVGVYDDTDAAASWAYGFADSMLKVREP